MSLRTLSTLAIASVALGSLTGCQDQQSPFLDITSEEDESNQNGNNNDNGNNNNNNGPGDSDAPGGDSGVGTEICDGWDNDRDGEVDEGTDGEACTTDFSTSGTSACVNGRLVCRECTPGETRTRECACAGFQARDVCNSVGRWLAGVCDGCAQPVTSAPCGMCGHRGPDGECIQGDPCKNGDEKYVRCDVCAPGDVNCGSSCYGEKWVCMGDCNWVKIEECAARNSFDRCDSDRSYFEECGNCGRRMVQCDLCFWTKGECKDEGACTPGTTKSVPCIEGGCAEGLTTTVSCGDNCEWLPPESCGGCVVGPPNVTAMECMPGYNCGGYLHYEQCQALETKTICGGARTITVGHEVQWDVGACDVQCSPGSVVGTEECADGYGTITIICDDTCQPSVGGPGCVVGTCECTVGEIENVTVPCPSKCDTYNRHRVCNEWCHWDPWINDTTCPPRECTKDERDTDPCGANNCGTYYRTCGSTCTWSPYSTCDVPTPSCTPGATQDITTACPAGCGTERIERRTCGTCGSWGTAVVIQSCATTCEPAARPSTSCSVGSCTNGSRTVSCESSSCSWGTGDCVLPTCIDGQTSTPCASGCGSATTTTTCSECGIASTTTTQCPTVTCSAGATRQVDCGYCEFKRTDTCNSSCSGWVPGTCPPNTCN